MPFSPIQVSKAWLYYELSKIAPVETVQGFETAQERERLGLKQPNARPKVQNQKI